jgi:hypothetical protein
MCRVMVILCQWDFNEQIEKLVKLLLCTSENCSRKFRAWVRFVPSVNQWLNICCNEKAYNNAAGINAT